jgi:hypothetical protein
LFARRRLDSGSGRWEYASHTGRFAHEDRVEADHGPAEAIGDTDDHQAESTDEQAETARHTDAGEA